jgi:predicted transcriptional regulator of viral defense system
MRTKSLAESSESRSVRRTKRRSGSSLSTLIEELQSRGKYTFTKTYALQRLGGTARALEAAARRLFAKGRLAAPRRGFYVIVPLEYRSAGAPPPMWFVDQLMKFHIQPYYVGLLTAAELHGAAHQRPQEFQVITASPLRPIVVGRVRIVFYTKGHLERTPVETVKTPTGYVQVSTPEATAFDLVRYVQAAGHLDNVATVLGELIDTLSGPRLLSAARAGVELSVVQRTGYLIEAVGGVGATDKLAEWLTRQKPRVVPLRPDRPIDGAATNRRWQLAVNEEIEPDS